jgi:hypothetical protein
LPAGSPIELTVEIDESRHICVRAFVPRLFQVFEGSFVPEVYEVSLNATAARFADLKGDLAWKGRIQKANPRSEVARVLDDLKATEMMESIDRNLERAKKGERDALIRAHKSVLELAGTLNQLAVIQRPARIALILAASRRRLDELESEYQRSQGDDAALARIEAAIGSLVRESSVLALLSQADAHTKPEWVLNSFGDDGQDI